ncbi:GNAT family N-acetyltransferase [Pseudomonas helleri]|uniref:GNAT family N-acetyltransferase n=1 Tax=Pseudomonas helleri TaxID=1608996 RepID=UPI0006547599|nr:GNAT family N-acetyltransferase [Pseudomonas helleri]KMM99590.1 GCN5 family acetyltransferase [Pseudomonas helleri]
MKKTIRVANVGDIDTIFEIRTRVRENHLSREQLADIGVTPEAIREVIANAPCIWVAEVDGTPVGFSMADLQDACVFAAFVLPDYEGLGLGRLLMAKAEAFLFEQHSTIWLETAEASRANGFYRALGWQPVKNLPEGDIRFEKSTPTLRSS